MIKNSFQEKRDFYISWKWLINLWYFLSIGSIQFRNKHQYFSEIKIAQNVEGQMIASSTFWLLHNTNFTHKLLKYRFVC